MSLELLSHEQQGALSTLQVITVPTLQAWKKPKQESRHGILPSTHTPQALPGLGGGTFSKLFSSPSLRRASSEEPQPKVLKQ